jgi:hypothetical protein
LDKCLSVLKPSGHYSHIQNLGTDPAVMQRLRQQHEAGKGPSVSHTFVTHNGGQLGQVLQMMADGKVKLEVAKVSRLASIAAAAAAAAAGPGGLKDGRVMATIQCWQYWAGASYSTVLKFFDVLAGVPFPDSGIHNMALASMHKLRASGNHTPCRTLCACTAASMTQQ